MNDVDGRVSPRENRRAFAARIDERESSGGIIADHAAYEAAPKGEIAAESPLQTVRRQIQEHTKRLTFFTDQLRQHTDKIHGAEAQSDHRTDRMSQTLRGDVPQMPAIWEALTELDFASAALGHEIERATTLA